MRRNGPLARSLRPDPGREKFVIRSPDKRSYTRVPAPHAGLMSPVTRAAKAWRLVQIGVDAGAFVVGTCGRESADSCARLSPYYSSGLSNTTIRAADQSA